MNLAGEPRGDIIAFRHERAFAAAGEEARGGLYAIGERWDRFGGLDARGDGAESVKFDAGRVDMGVCGVGG